MRDHRTMFATGAGIVVWMGLSLMAQAQTTAPSVPTSGQQAAQKQIDVGNALMEKERYTDALVQYRTALSADPDEPSLLYNAGLAAYLSKKYEAAVPYWTHFVQVVPEEWRVHAKLVQTYQALGDLKKCDEARAALFKLRNGHKLPELNKQNSYCREQFEVDGQPVFAYEFYEPSGKIATRYKFVVVDKVTDSEKYRIDLESDAFDNDLAKERGELKSGEKVFSLDGYYFNPLGRLETQKLFAFYNTEPTYEAAKADVIRVIQGHLKSGAGSVHVVLPSH